jgi:pimeloyl-ACP methyl ester carboxylesterase
MARSKAARIALRVARVLVLVYVGILLFYYNMQRRLLYHPQKVTLEYGQNVAKQAGFDAWKDANGQIIGWKRVDASTDPHKQLLIVHGNAGSAIDRLDYADKLRLIEPVDVYVLEYPGYGVREGSPSQPAFFEAADQAVELLKGGGPLYVFGESIGTGVAAHLAGAQPDTVRGVLLQAPYHNLTDVAIYHMPFLPVRWLLKDKYPAASYLEKYHGPVAVTVGGNDDIIPQRFSRQLYGAYNGPKKLWEFPNSGHNDLLPESEAWWRELVTFWKTSSTNSSPAPR